jgi:hypothetical protein
MHCLFANDIKTRKTAFLLLHFFLSNFNSFFLLSFTMGKVDFLMNNLYISTFYGGPGIWDQ